MAFLDPARLDFRLSNASPARNAGSASGFPPVDFADVVRPKEGISDQGAFESNQYTSSKTFSTVSAKPNPPSITLVQ
jgi:hypothetical protein